MVAVSEAAITEYSISVMLIDYLPRNLQFLPLNNVVHEIILRQKKTTDFNKGKTPFKQTTCG